MSSRLSYITMEAVRGFRRNLLLAVSMIVIVSISLTLLGIALLAGKQAQLYQGYWYGKIQVSVFLTQNVTPAERASIHQQLAAMPQVQTIYYESQQEAYQHFKEQFANSPDMLRNVTPSALPQSYRVKLYNPTEYQVVHDQLCTSPAGGGADICEPGVDQVVDQQTLVNRLFSLLDLFRNSFYVLAAVLGLAAIVLIAVTVRVAAFARRRETSIMKLVGASNTYIRLPFLAEGVFAGLVGALVSLVLLRLGLYYVGKVRDQVAFLQTQPLVGMHEFWSSWMILLVLGVVVAGGASFLALRKYVRV